MRRQAVALLAAVPLVLAACGGLGAQSDDHPLAAEDVPYDLLAPSTTTTTEAPSPTTTLPWRTNLWFINRDRLEPVQRQLRTQPNVRSVLDLMLRGPSTREPQALRSALRTGDASTASPTGGALTIELADDFGLRSSSEQILALGQLVFTVTEVPGVGRVVFRIDGIDLTVPLPNGQLRDGSVSRDDFATLVFPGSTPPIAG